MGYGGAALIKGIHTVRRRTLGKPDRWYVYAWRGGPCIATRVGGGKPVLTRDEVRALHEAIEADRKVPPGTLLEIIRAWRGSGSDTASPEWKRLEPSTRQTWGRQLDLIEAKWAETPLSLWSDHRMVSKVVAWRDSRSTSPRSADIGVTVLKALLDFARLRGRVSCNVAENIPRLYRGGNREEIIWTDDDIACFAAVAPQRITDALLLCSLTGLRRADLLALKWSEIDDLQITRTATKKSRGKRRRAIIPLLDETRTLLTELRERYRATGVDHVLVDSRGRPWKAASFSAQFNAARDEAGIVEPENADLGLPARKKHLHDVRGTFCTRLFKTSLSHQQIATIMAWSPERVQNIRRVYVDDAAIVMAMAEHISKATVKRPVK